MSRTTSQESQENEGAQGETADAVRSSTAEGRGTLGWSGDWSAQQISAVAARVSAVLVAFGLIGFGLGFVLGPSYLARAEFALPANQSDLVLDDHASVLIDTFTSDAVLGPVAQRFLVDVGDLRRRVDVALEVGTDVALETEIEARPATLVVEVNDNSYGRAVAINRAIFAQYLLEVDGRPVRPLDEPAVSHESGLATGLRGALSVIPVGLPFAALVSWQTRRRQLWSS